MPTTTEHTTEDCEGIKILRGCNVHLTFANGVTVSILKGANR